MINHLMAGKILQRLTIRWPEKAWTTTADGIHTSLADTITPTV